MRHRPNNLDELFEIMLADESWYCAPEIFGYLDWSQLPTFGGDCPEHENHDSLIDVTFTWECAEVWSWDHDRVIVSWTADQLEMITRDEFLYS